MRIRPARTKGPTNLDCKKISWGSNTCCLFLVFDVVFTTILFLSSFLTVANRQPHLFCQLLTEIVHPRPQSGCQSVMGFVIMAKCQVDQLHWGYKLKQYSVILVTDHPISQTTRGWTHCLCQALALLTMNHTFPSTLPNEH